MAGRSYTEVAAFPSSSHESFYIVKKDDIGQLSCNCPGWIFYAKKTGKPCKHVRAAEKGEFPIGNIKTSSISAPLSLLQESRRKVNWT